MDDEKPFDITDWGVLFPLAGSNTAGWGSVYTGAYSTADGSRVEDVTLDRVGRVDLHYVEYGDCAETSVALLVELTDGTWAAAMGSCDTTGWDCQAGVQWKVAPTRQEAIEQGLDRYNRVALGVPLDGES